MPQKRDIIVIGASAGGVDALQKIVAKLPGDFAASIFVVIHFLPEAQSHLPAILSRAGPLAARHPEDGEVFRPGTIYCAPPDLHLMLEGDHILLVRGPRENRTRPAINPLFRSAAMVGGPRAIGVILTGTLDDGTAGLWSIKRMGGTAVAQSDALFDEMPRTAVAHVAVDHHVPLLEIPALLDRLTREQIAASTALPVPNVIRFTENAAKMKPQDISLDQIGRRSVFSCPECNGALWEVDEGVLQYRCHVGHVFSVDSLEEGQNTTVEQSLWSALRALKESAALDQRLSERAEEGNLDQAAQRYRESANTKREQVARLLEFLARMRPEKPD